MLGSSIVGHVVGICISEAKHNCFALYLNRCLQNEKKNQFEFLKHVFLCKVVIYLYNPRFLYSPQRLGFVPRLSVFIAIVKLLKAF